MSAAIAAVGATLAVGAMSSEASANAGRAQSQAADRANQFSQTQTEEMQRRAEPWRESGTFANNLLTQGIDSGDLTRKFSMNDFHQDPGYQFQLGQGELAMQRSAAASGMLNSEGTQQRLNAYGQGMANTSYQQALNNFTQNQQQRYNMLSGMSNQGLASTGMINNASTNYMNTAGSNMLGQGNAESAGMVGQANAWGNAINNGANQYMNYQAMNGGQNKGQDYGALSKYSIGAFDSNNLAGGSGPDMGATGGAAEDLYTRLT